MIGETDKLFNYAESKVDDDKNLILMYLLDQHNTMSELVDSEIDIVKDEIPHDDDNLDINNLLERIKKKEGKILNLSFWLQKNFILKYSLLFRSCLSETGCEDDEEAQVCDGGSQ